VSEALIEWLPDQPVDFRQRCASVDKSDGERGDSLRALASYALDSNGLHRLARSVTAAIQSNSVKPLTPLRLGLISNGTTELLIPTLIGSAARYGIALSVAAAPFGVTAQAAFEANSDILAAKPDVVLMALDYRAFFADHILDDTHAVSHVDAAIDLIASIAQAFATACRASIIVQTIAAPPERMFGSFDRRQPGSLAWLVANFNARLCSEVAGPGVSVLDVESLAATVGMHAWYDRRQWMTARLPFAPRAMPLYGEHVARLVGAMRGKSRKVLVLDLDNTLWGGIVGDDGMDGLRLGQGEPVGEAFLDLQRAALALKQRGILLAICSKNEEAVARLAVREHSEMVLREHDFAAMQINWNDKASNLEAISDYLSLGLDTFVFFDDNPVEREQVRSALPQVCVPELPKDPAGYARILLTSGFFESIAFSNEDRSRAQHYATNAKRQSLLANSRDLSSFLNSLEMSATFIDGGTAGWQRFAQLINKSNQFHLTVRRYTEAEVLAMAADPSTLTLQVALSDRFGNNGMISAIICRPLDGDWEIDTWVMSCRVLNRQVEAAVLNEVVRRAAAAGIRRLRGVYRATARNQMVAGHYEKLGFKLEASNPEEARWVLDVAEFAPLANFIRTAPHAVTLTTDA